MTPDYKKNFGLAIRGWRKRLGLSQEELAERADLHRTYVCDIERGGRNVSLQNIERLAKALDISTQTLFGGLVEPPGSARSVTKIMPAFQLGDILLVEDEPDDVTLTLRALHRAKIANQIVVAGDGQIALDYLFCTGIYANRAFENPPQLILLDLKLPNLSGWDVLRRIKANERTRTIPVVILTSSQQDLDFVAGKQLGADAYIIKPVDFQNLTEVTPQLRLHWALLNQAAASGPEHLPKSG